MKMMQKIRPLAVAVFALAIMGQSAFAANGYSDIENHWNRENILKWQESEVISGYKDGSFKPDNSITRAEFSVILSRVFKMPAADAAAPSFTDVPSDAWYANAARQMRLAGILNGYGDGTFRPNQYITRQEAGVALSRAFEVSGADVQVLKSYADGSEVDDWAASNVAGLIQEGYLRGSNNHINVKNNMTRAELVMFIESMAGNVWDGSQTSAKIEGNLVVNSASAVLKDMTIDGDLFLTQGVGEGTAELNNVQISGRLVILGGGENSVHLRDSHITKAMIINDAQNRVRVVIEGSTTIADTVLKSGATLQNTGNADLIGALTVQGAGTGAVVQLEGNFGEVTVRDNRPSVRLSSGTIQNFVVDKSTQQPIIALSSGTRIASMEARAAAQITGSGAISRAVIQSGGVVSSVEPGQIMLSDNVTMKVGDRVVSVSTGPAGISGGGSGGSSGSGGESGTPGDSTTPGNSETPGNSDGSESPGGSNTNPSMPSYIKSWKVSSIGPVKYVSIAFETGTRADYAFAIDGADVTDMFTNVTTEGTVVKYELKSGQKALVITRISDNTTATLPLG